MHTVRIDKNLALQAKDPVQGNNDQDNLSTGQLMADLAKLFKSLIAIANSQNSSRNSLIEDVFNFSKKSAESLSLQTTLEGTGMIMGGVLGGALSIGALKMNSDMCSKIQDKNTQITNIKIASAPTQPVDALPDAARVVAATDAAPASDPATAGAGQGAAPGPISETIK